MNYFFSSIVPVMMLVIVAWGMMSGIDVYGAFTSGVKRGASSAVSVFPALLAVFVAVGVFKTSGLSDFLIRLLSPLSRAIGFPTELLPFCLLRPVSGSGSLALASDLFSSYGPDSFIGRCASVMMGSTETTFYTMAVYFGACGVKNVRYALKCALLADLFSMILSVTLTYYFR